MATIEEYYYSINYFGYNLLGKHLGQMLCRIHIASLVTYLLSKHHLDLHTDLARQPAKEVILENEEQHKLL